MKPAQWVTIGIVLTLISLLGICYTTKQSLQIKYTKLEASVKIQNEAIESNRIDYEKKLNEYRNRKPRTVYIPTYINVERSNCDDVKNLLDGIDTDSF